MYSDLISFGRFPRSTDGLTQEFKDDGDAHDAAHIIFFSYRWINSDPWDNSPDDAEITQYQRVIKAVEAFVQLHPTVDRDSLGIWIDFACIDHGNPLPGIAALPMVLAQCDALISLVNKDYHGSAWCSIEVMMAQGLRKAYKQHWWYECVEAQPEPGEDANGSQAILREGPADLETSLAGKCLRFEEDRSKVLFLERQIRLLC